MTTALPTSQQLADWLLQSMGLRGAGTVKATTSKKARKDNPIPEAWPHLINDVAKALGIRVGLEQKQAIYEALRGYDLRVSALSDHGVPLQDRLTVVARVMAPRVGMRLGALAALADQDRWALKAQLPDLGDWFERPLSPRLIARVVHGILTCWDPKYARLRTQTDRQGRLAELGVARRTWESWCSPGRASTPDLTTLSGIWEAIDPANREKAEHLLRLGRAFMGMRQKLEEYGGPEFVDQVERIIGLWAAHTRDRLRDEALLVEISKSMGSDCDVGLAEREAEALVALQCFLPSPILIADLATRIQPGDQRFLPQTPPWEWIQGHWRVLAFIHSLATGRLPPDFQGTARLPSKELATQAGRVLEQERVLIVSAAQQLDPHRVLKLYLRLLGELGVSLTPAETHQWVQDGLDQRALPARAEAILPDAAVRATPHLAAARMRRLASEGRLEEVWDWLPAVRNRPSSSWSARRDACAALTEVAHKSLDLVLKQPESPVPLRSLSMEVSAEEWALLLSEVPQIKRSLEMPSRIYRLAAEFLGHKMTAAQEAQLQVLLFPLAVRVDGGLAVLNQDPSPAGLLGRTHADRIRHLLDNGSEDGGLLACWVLWEELSGRPDKRARRLANHRGAGATIEEWSRVFQADGLCPEPAE